MGSRLTWPHGPPVSKAFFGPFLCVKAFFGPFLCGGTSQKKLGSVGAGVRRMGSHLTWPHGRPVSKAFLDPFCVRRLFLDPFCVVGCSKKTLAVWGQVFRFLVRFFQPILE